MKSVLNPLKFSYVLILFLVAGFSYLHRWNSDDGNGWEATIDGDSKGYYAFLPAIFIYDDLTFEFFNQPQNATIARYYHPRFQVETESGTVNKNYVGVAVLISPFFLVAHSVTWLIGEEQSGYSRPYMLAVISAALFYLLMGVFFTTRLIRTFSISEKSAAITISVLSIGTILFYYTAIHSAMAHVYSFFCISTFAFYTRLFFINRRMRDLIIAALLLGLITIVRPMNLIVLAVLPFLAGSAEHFRRTLFMISVKPMFLLRAVLVFFAVICIQFSLFKFQTGSWFIWSYGDEGFNFSNPELYNVLFSFRKGLFVYSPVLLLLLPGMFFMFKRDLFQGAAFAGFFLILIYVISSWWNWFYGDGFGQRAFIDFFPLFAIPIGLTFDKLWNRKQHILVVLLPIAFIGYNLLQTYQYRYRIIHPDSMNFEKYSYIFLKTGDEYRDIFAGNPDIIYDKISEQPLVTFNFVNKNGEWNWCQDCEGASSEDEVIFDSNSEFGRSIEIPVNDFSSHTAGIFVKGELLRLENELNACSEAYLVCSIEKPSGEVEFWNGVKLNELPSEKTMLWRRREFGFLLPLKSKPESTIKIYIWNKEKRAFRVKHFNLNFYSVSKRK